MKRLLVGSLLVFAACGDSVDFDDLPDGLEDARCDALVRCNGIQDSKTCDAAFNLDSADFDTIRTGIKNGTIKYDGDKAAECLDQLGGAGCTFDGFHETNACDGVFTGTVPAGGTCSIDLQCANQGDCQLAGNCDPDTQCCTGTCVAGTIESAIGGPCDDEIHECAVNAYCKPGTGQGPGTCAALVSGEGTACDALQACANPLYCNINFQTDMGTCKKPAASNAACSRMDLIPCADSRDYCDQTSLTCVRRVAVGGTCSNTLPCVGFSSCISGTCVADIPLGGACTADGGADCAGNLDCISGTCQVPPTGMVCTL